MPAQLAYSKKVTALELLLFTQDPVDHVGNSTACSVQSLCMPDVMPGANIGVRPFSLIWLDTCTSYPKGLAVAGYVLYVRPPPVPL